MSYVPQTKPYKHQVDYLRQSVHRTAYALFAEMGTGKTKMILDEVGILDEEGLVDTVLVVSGKGNYLNWVGEIRTHFPRRLDPLVMTWDGSHTQRWRGLFREFLTERERPRFFLVNVEAIAASPRAMTAVRQLLGTSKRRMVVIDESTLIKNHEAVLTINMCNLAKNSEYRRITTGNPTPNSPMDLWGQFEFLGGSLLGHRSFYSFRARYAVLQDVHIGNGRTRKVMVAPKNLDELSQIVAQHSFRVTKDECLDLPPKIYQMRHVLMTDEQRRVYEEIKKFAMSELEREGQTRQVSSEVAIGQLSKMHQVLCGNVLDDDGNATPIANNRIDAMLEICAESGRQTIVWCAYQSNVRDCVAALKKEFGPTSTVEYYGPTSVQDRQEAIRKFQSGEAHFFVGTPHTAGKGITLTAAKTVIYYSNSYNLEHRVQSEDRAHRIGQTGSVNYVDLTIEGTLDEKIIKALRAKIDVSSQIMGDGWREWLI